MELNSRNNFNTVQELLPSPAGWSANSVVPAVQARPETHSEGGGGGGGAEVIIMTGMHFWWIVG